MSCRERIEQIGAYLDGELAGAELEELRRHLAECAECRRELAQQQKLWSLLEEASSPAEASEHLYARILGRTTRRKERRPAVRILRWAAPLAAAATLVLAVTLWHAGQTTTTLDPTDLAIIQNLDVLEKLDLLEEFDTIKTAVDNPDLLSDPEAWESLPQEDAS